MLLSDLGGYEALEGFLIADMILLALCVVTCVGALVWIARGGGDRDV